jgi:hypothetical protein
MTDSKSRDNESGTIFGINLYDGRKSKAESHGRISSLVRRELTNHVPHIVRVNPNAVSCSQKTQCGYKGVISSFEVDFLLDIKHYHKHFIQIGLKSGKLQLILRPFSGNIILPKVIIKPQTKIRRENMDSKSAKVSMKELSLTYERSKNIAGEEDVIQISQGGLPEAPFWYFRVYKDKILEGKATDLACKNNPHGEHRCGGMYCFIVEEGDWSYHYEIYPKMNGFLRFFAEIVLKRECKKLIYIYNYIVKQKFKKKLSTGKWKCYASRE